MNPAPSATLERLTRLQKLTEQYSKFSNTRPGLGLVLAAIVIVLIRFLPAQTNFHGVYYVIVATGIWLEIRRFLNARLFITQFVGCFKAD
jgi:hypothetical protein